MWYLMLKDKVIMTKNDVIFTTAMKTFCLDAKNRVKNLINVFKKLCIENYQLKVK